jgi:putative FmdB family regulatory protein
MPIFEYDCLDCGRQFEILLRTAEAEVCCPFCGKQHLERLVSLCGVSSEASRAANLAAAHQRAAARRSEKQRGDHAEHHDHFSDTASGTD